MISIVHETGRETKINWAKPMSPASGKMLETVWAKIRFGGVPISVIMPAVEQVIATISKSALPKGAMPSASPVISSSFVMMANVFGTIVRAHAVFEIQNESNVVTKQIPNNKIFGLKPKIKTVFNAILE